MSFQTQERQILLVSGIIRTSHNNIVAIDIINIIVAFLRIVFDFDIIDKKYGIKDVLEINDIVNHNKIILPGYCETVGIVISINSGSIKAGFAGNEEPTIAIPNVIGRNKNDDIFIGHQVKNKVMLTSYMNPIKNGDIDNWDGFKAIILRILSKLKGKQNIAVLMSECYAFSKESREKMAQFMFEEIGICGFYSWSRALLSFYAAGRNGGLSIISDYHCTEIVPTYEWYTLHEQSMRIPIGRRDILRYLEYNKDQLNCDNDAFDILFDPKLCALEEQKQCEGIIQCVNRCIAKCDVDIRGHMCSNIVLSGINTMDVDVNSDGDKNALSVRLHEALKYSKYKYKVISPSERAESSWIGGSILISLSTFQEQWMTKMEYEQHGASYINKKCI